MFCDGCFGNTVSHGFLMLCNTPVDEGCPKTVEKSDTKGAEDVEEGNAEEFDGGNALVGVEEKPETVQFSPL